MIGYGGVMAADAWTQAVRSLQTARDEALARLAAIDKALINLGAVDQVSRPLDLPEKQTLAEAIMRLLETQGGAWDAKAIVGALREENYSGLNEADPVPAVRTALSRLARSGRLLKPSYGMYKAPTQLFDPWQPDATPLSEDEERQLIEEARSDRFDFDPGEEPF
jgi:hypothetical protein